MLINVIPAGEAPLQVEVDGALQIRQLKETIEAMIANQLWTAATMSLFYGDIELENTSTVQQNNITELCTLQAVLFDEALYQDTLSLPPYDAGLFPTYEDDSSIGNMEFTLEELTGIPAGTVDVKMILPHNFEANLVLNFSATHHFQTCGQLREKIDNDPPSWLPKLEAYAILSNVNAFLVENVDDFDDRKNGGVVLVRSDGYGDALCKGRGYKGEAPMAISIEKPAGKFKISGEIILDRYEIVGDLWTRRRIHVAGHDAFSLIQWMDTPSKRKDTMKEDVSKVGKAVGELKLQLNAVATDVTDLKKDVASVNQNLTGLHTTLTALLGRLPQQPAQDPDTSV